MIQDPSAYFILYHSHKAPCALKRDRACCRCPDSSCRTGAAPPSPSRPPRSLRSTLAQPRHQSISPGSEKLNLWFEFSFKVFKVTSSPGACLLGGKLSSASGCQASWENAGPAPLGPRTRDQSQCLDAENVRMMIVDIL